MTVTPAAALIVGIKLALKPSNVATVGIFDRSNAVSETPVGVMEGGTGEITVVLTIPPVIPIEVEVEYNAGDDDISIVSGSILYFDSSNYDQPQTVVLAAAEDEDYDEGAGQVILSGSHSETIKVFVHEVENDVRPGFVITGDEPIVIDEGGTASFAVALTDPPAGPITVAVVVETQDSNISVVSGSILNFDGSNYDQPQTVELVAAYDADYENRMNQISISG